jgi:hypothetical protein
LDETAQTLVSHAQIVVSFGPSGSELSRLDEGLSGLLITALFKQSDPAIMKFFGCRNSLTSPCRREKNDYASEEACRNPQTQG